MKEVKYQLIGKGKYVINTRQRPEEEKKVFANRITGYFANM